MKDIKQVIVVRKDLNMRKGKIAAQVSHGCMKIFFDKFTEEYEYPYSRSKDSYFLTGWSIPKLPYFQEYLEGRFKKIVVSVNSEQELLDIYTLAKEKKIHVALITDAGLTEFNNVPTNTVVALGPWDADELDKITGHLPLL